MSATTAPKQRIHKSIEEKMKIVACVEGGMSHQAAANEFGISRTAVTKMVKEKDLIAAKHEQPDLKRPRRRAATTDSEDAASSETDRKTNKSDVMNLIDAVHVLSAKRTTRPRILLAASGSVATVKVPELAVKLSAVADVRIVLTKAATFFLAKASAYNSDMYEQFQKLQLEILHDEDEWGGWNSRGDPVLHIQLRDWADILCIAPLSANTMAKLAHGLCDNLLTCIVRAWSCRKPLLVAPAMNTQMYLHPATGKQLGLMREYGYDIIPPVCKTLACGETGNGALAPVETIHDAILAALKVPPGHAI